MVVLRRCCCIDRCACSNASIAPGSDVVLLHGPRMMVDDNANDCDCGGPCQPRRATTWPMCAISVLPGSDGHQQVRRLGSQPAMVVLARLAGTAGFCLHIRLIPGARVCSRCGVAVMTTPAKPLPLLVRLANHRLRAAWLSWPCSDGALLSLLHRPLCVLQCLDRPRLERVLLHGPHMMVDDDAANDCDCSGPSQPRRATTWPICAISVLP